MAGGGLTETVDGSTLVDQLVGSNAPSPKFSEVAWFL